MKNSENLTRIIIEKRNSTKHIILWLIILIFFAVVEYITLKRFFSFFIFLVLIIPFILKDYNKNDKYLSEILIFDDFLQLIYKCGNMVVSQRNIKKKDIKNFYVEAYIKEQHARAYSADTNIKIEIQDSEYPIVYKCSKDISSTPLTGLFDSVYQTIINLVTIHDKIPNFSYKITGNCEIAKAQIKHYYNTQNRKIGILEDFKINFSSATLFGKFGMIIAASAILFCLAVFILLLCFCIYLCISDIILLIH